ncbi:hypothetical protein HGP05_00195 [Streptococcus sanguinis]|uniref:Uncharacterized protein n=1 Tax=Streptococcus sanguinis TaxID=1305 RepID=A0A7Y0VB04_STRSA|nr:hypothetical protein [Streptococcus sanguinis]
MTALVFGREPSSSSGVTSDFFSSFLVDDCFALFLSTDLVELAALDGIVPADFTVASLLSLTTSSLDDGVLAGFLVSVLKM